MTKKHDAVKKWNRWKQFIEDEKKNRLKQPKKLGEIISLKNKQ